MVIRLITLVILTLSIAAIPVFSQSDTAACPKFEVIGPPAIISRGKPATFVLQLDRDLSEQFKYEWTVTNARIISGQGTRAVEIVSDDYGVTIEAKITIEGLPPTCKRTATELAGVEAKLEGQPVDVYGELPSDDQRGRLDLFFSELANNPNNKGFIVISAAKRNDNREVKRRVAFVLRHARFRGVDKSILLFGTEYQGGVRTILWRVPPGADLPCPIKTCQRLDVNR